MAAVILDQGLTTRWKAIYGSTGFSTPNRISLFTSVGGGTITPSTLLANFVEVTAIMGYLAKAPTGADWGYTLDTTLHQITAQSNWSFVFTSGAGVTVAGWYMWQSIALVAYIGEIFASPVVIPPGGGTLPLSVLDVYHNC